MGCKAFPVAERVEHVRTVGQPLVGSSCKHVSSHSSTYYVRTQAFDGYRHRFSVDALTNMSLMVYRLTVDAIGNSIRRRGLYSGVARVNLVCLEPSLSPNRAQANCGLTTIKIALVSFKRPAKRFHACQQRFRASSSAEEQFGI